MPKAARTHQFTKPVNRRSPAETARLQEEAREYTKTLSLLARMGLENRKSLLERMSSPTPEISLPLIERIEYQIPDPIPSTLHFRRKKNLLRIKEYRPLLETVMDRIGKVFDQLAYEETQAKQNGTPARVPKKLTNRVWKVFERFQDFYEGTEELGHKMTNEDWRQLKGALRQFKMISLHQWEERLVDICEEIDELNIVFPDV
jgi:hypothetical protein